MIYILAVMGCLVTYSCISRRRALEVAGARETFRHDLLRHGIPVLMTFTGIILFYAGLDLYIRLHDRDTTVLRALHELEDRMAELRILTEGLKPAAWLSLAVLAVLFGVAAWSARARDRFPGSQPRTRSRWLAPVAATFSRYSKAVAVACTALTLLCSFTFFASALGPAQGELKLRIKKVEEDTVWLGAGLADAFADEVRDQLLRQAVAEAPEPVIAAIREASDLAAEQERLVRAQEDARARLGLAEQPGVREVAQAVTRRNSTLENVVNAAEAAPARWPQIQERAPLESHPEEVSTESLEELAQRLTNLRESQAARAFAILQLKERKKLTGKLLGMLLDAKRVEVLAPLFDAFPFADVILRVAQSSLNDLAARMAEKHVVEPYLERLARQALAGPGVDLQPALTTEAEKFVREHGAIEDRWQQIERSGLLVSLGGRREALAVKAREAREIGKRLTAESARQGRALEAERSELLRSLSPPRLDEFSREFPPRDPAARASLSSRERNYLEITEKFGQEQPYREDVAEYLRELIEKCKEGPVSIEKVTALGVLMSTVASAGAASARLQGLEQTAGTAFRLSPVPRRPPPRPSRVPRWGSSGPTWRYPGAEMDPTTGRPKPPRPRPPRPIARR